MYLYNSFLGARIKYEREAEKEKRQKKGKRRKKTDERKIKKIFISLE